MPICARALLRFSYVPEDPFGAHMCPYLPVHPFGAYMSAGTTLVVEHREVVWDQEVVEHREVVWDQEVVEHWEVVEHRRQWSTGRQWSIGRQSRPKWRSPTGLR